MNIETQIRLDRFKARDYQKESETMICLYCEKALNETEKEINISKTESGWIYDHCNYEKEFRQKEQNELINRIKKNKDKEAMRLIFK